MRAELADWIAAALYVAAGRSADEPEFAVWEAGLASTPEEGAVAATEAMLAEVDLAKHFPTPAAFNAYARRERKGTPQWPALSPGQLTPKEDGLAHIAALRTVLAKCERP